MYEYYKTKCNARECVAYERMVLAFQNKRETVECGNNVTGNQQAGDVYFGVTCDHPELFWLPPKVNLTGRRGGGLLSFSNEVNIQNLYDDAQIQRMSTAIENVKKQLQPTLQRCANDVEKEKAVCDHLLRTVVYEIHDTYNLNAGTPLVYGRGQCAGIARAAKLLLDFVGIKSIVITGQGMSPGKPPEAHAWNLVEIDGQWYHLDVTFMIGHNPNKREPFYYEFFNQSDDEARANHSWDSSKFPVCPQQWDKRKFPRMFATNNGTQTQPQTQQRIPLNGIRQFGQTQPQGNARQTPSNEVSVNTLFEFKQVLQKALQEGKTSLNVRVNIYCETQEEFRGLINRACQTVLQQMQLQCEMKCGIGRQDVMLSWKLL